MEKAHAIWIEPMKVPMYSDAVNGGSFVRGRNFQPLEVPRYHEKPIMESNSSIEELVYSFMGKQNINSNSKVIRRIARDSPLTHRIIFDSGEIVLNITNQGLEVFTRKYLENGKSEIKSYLPAKQLAPKYTPELVLYNAEMSISNRIKEKAKQEQDMIYKQKMEDYFNNQRKMLERKRKLEQAQSKALERMALAVAV